MEIEGAGAVAVRFRFFYEWDAKVLQAARPKINVLRCSDHKADVIDALNRAQPGWIREFVDRQIVLTRRKIDVIRIRFPLERAFR